MDDGRPSGGEHNRRRKETARAGARAPCRTQRAGVLRLGIARECPAFVVTVSGLVSRSERYLRPALLGRKPVDGARGRPQRSAREP